MTANTITQDQADQVATTLAAAEPTLDPGRGKAGKGGRADLATAATAVGLTQSALRSGLDKGKSLAQIATDNGTSVDTLISALVTAAKRRPRRASRPRSMPAG